MTQVVPTSVFDTAANIAALNAQRRALTTERELLADAYMESMKVLERAGDLDDLIAAMNGFKVVYGPGWAKRIGMAGLPEPRTLESQIRAVHNDGVGRWSGTFPLLPGDQRPARGTWTVYQLLLDGDLLYIGSTGAFAERVKAHSRTKHFNTWRAAECRNEQECRDLESALIDRYRPPLNRMIPSPKLVLR